MIRVKCAKAVVSITPLQRLVSMATWLMGKLPSRGGGGDSDSALTSSATRNPGQSQPSPRISTNDIHGTLLQLHQIVCQLEQCRSSQPAIVAAFADVIRRDLLAKLWLLTEGGRGRCSWIRMAMMDLLVEVNY